MVISIITVIVGLVTLFGLPISKFPNIVPPEVQIQANYVGADALTLEQSVAAPIEEKMSGVDNMNYLFSLNANNGLMRMYRQLRRADGPERGSGPDVFTLFAGGKPVAGRRAQSGRAGAKSDFVAVSVCLGVFPQGDARRAVSGQLCLHQHV